MQLSIRYSFIYIQIDMISSTIFFWVLPAMYVVFTLVFTAIAHAEGGLASARKGAAAFGIGGLAIILDTQRSLFPGWFFTLAVPLHWMVLIFTADAFLARHGDRTPPRPVAVLFLIGLAINLYATFVVNSVQIRVPNASTVAILLLTLSLPRFYRRNMVLLDKLIAAAITASWLCYVVRFAFYFTLDQSQEYMRQALWSQYMIMFYFTSGITALTLAFLLILSITSDLVARHHAASTVDPLTGIANRRGFDQMVDQQSAGGPGIGAVMMIDLDRFKLINDTHGHAAGDAVLAAAARTLKDGCAGFGSLARLGGEEFVVLVPFVYAEGAGQMAQLLLTALAETVPPEPYGDIRFTVSIGVAARAVGETVGETMRRADMALYEAKSAGRARVQLATDETPGRQLSVA